MKTKTVISVGCGVLALVCTITLLAQGVPSGAGGRGDELAQLRATIRESEGRLKRLESGARKSAAAAAESRRQAAALDSLMRLLESRQGEIAAEMIALRSHRDSLDDVRSRMSDEYVRVARALYRRRLLAPSASMLLMPEEQRRLALAERLFARYGKRQTERARNIAGLRDSLERKDALLEVRQSQQLALLADRREQAEKLAHLEERYTDELRQAESERGVLEAFISRKNKEAKQIEGMIARLAAKEEKEEGITSTPKAKGGTKPAKAATKEKAKKSEKKTTRTQGTASANKKGGSQKKETQTASSTSTSSAREKSATPFNPGWPVSSRKVLNAYGERRNSRTNTVTFNPGVNIAAKKGSTVSAAGSGRVSLVSWLPSYGTVVIVEHEGGWRTVYANLASAEISQGAKVSRGSRVGSVGESIDGEYLHFEIWHDQTRFDPMTMLK